MTDISAFLFGPNSGGHSKVLKTPYMLCVEVGRLAILEASQNRITRRIGHVESSAFWKLCLVCNRTHVRGCNHFPSKPSPM